MIPRYGYRVEQLFYNVWYFALSVAYARRIGAPIVLHTDTLGSKLLGHLPYDEVKLTLDDVDAPPRFWAAGKFYALRAEGDNRCIHIDGDVFIKKSSLWERIANTTADMLCQYKEHWRDDYANNALAQHIRQPYMAYRGMFNTGTLGVFNKELREKIIDNYFNALTTCSALPNRLLNDEYFTPDLVCEQQMIAHAAQHYNVECVLPRCNDVADIANSVGYQHVQSSKKFAQLGECKRALKTLNNEIYNNTLKICQSL